MGRWDITGKTKKMRKFVFLIIAVFGMAVCAKAQLAQITRVQVNTQNGTFESNTVHVFYQLTPEGMREVYDNGRDLEITISADYTVRPFLISGESYDTFYPVDNGNGRRKNGHLIEFKCVDHETAVKLRNNGLTTSDFRLSTRLR